MNKFLTIVLLVLCQVSLLQAKNWGRLSGSIQSTTHYYLSDKALSIGTPQNPWASNNYVQLNYNYGSFSAGLQYEAYIPPLSGYPYQLEGNKIVYRYLRFTKGIIDVTAGTFYEQFGNGLIFRAYENRDLGINNSLDGVRVILRPTDFIRITGVYGKQRKFLEMAHNNIKGLDADIIIDSIYQTCLNLKLGVGIVSRYEQYTGSESNFPSTVNASSLRACLNWKNLEINSEYVYKTDDPSLVNLYNSAHGTSFLLTSSYSGKGLGLFLSFRILDNMDFRGERESDGIYNMVNYLPANTRQHSYMLTNIYPYSTNSQNEMSVQGEMNYFFTKGNLLGGKYGTGVRINFSQARSLKKSGNSVYYQDINVEISKKWTPKFKSILTYVNLLSVKSDIAIADLRYMISSGLSLRTEIQHLWTKQDHGNWAAALAEVGYAPHWSFIVSDMVDYQYSQKVHYLNIGLGYSSNFARLSFGYGRQREGLVCAGGICQRVPSYKGFNLKLNINF